MMLKALRKTRIALQALALSLALVMPAVSYADAVDETPTMFAMVGDVLVVRPIMLAVTVVGAAAFVVALPFSAAGGNVKETGEVLVVGPAMTTFVRPVGHPFPGYKND
ncbi:MAG TPA: hypothetical protein VIM96_03530 [Pseudomonadales bacterium]|jgi:hypothetical protein